MQIGVAETELFTIIPTLHTLLGNLVRRVLESEMKPDHRADEKHLNASTPRDLHRSPDTIRESYPERDNDVTTTRVQGPDCDRVEKVPHTRPVSLSIGSCVTIKGTPTLPFINDPQLQVDFHTETNEESDIAFHFRVYFGHCVIMNSRECGAWKCEVRCNNVPFEDGKSFDVRISVLANEYQVTVNGQQCYSFAHRLPPCSVKMVQVCRDISLTSVCVCN
ncbi:galactoside-binding soluble lectin 13-like isoform X1 [Pongo pygmaeus]|uniref:Galectin n=1 Tax=Pongo abelii TaxID=9601 RepID=K7EU92_PONAB|nr:galactoside-binding soluble lectin 13-like isoform X1 [Pongo pygmaeus]XP_054396392.1 galactoside-binding soluble lectin 13 isoform X1 [Pongo abelii]XP_054396393.1 galactoside-binding soluble lectin 13 isoform X1 [Pongo abelii]XP_054396394.1 galactoside-binding soluble lectin 13 isoform X1 [Pongo abelii]XP_054396395.1 galactoside-binding soluble lectin 13 isoform X1 [Pongo abelii]